MTRFACEFRWKEIGNSAATSVRVREVNSTKFGVFDIGKSKCIKFAMCCVLINGGD